MHIPVGVITIPPLSIGQPSSSLIDLLPQSEHHLIISHVPMANGIPQPGPTPSIWAHPPQPQLSQGGNFYLGATNLLLPNLISVMDHHPI